LSSLEMPSLTTVGRQLYIHANACLSQDEAEVFAASIDVGGDVIVSGNGANYPCN